MGKPVIRNNDQARGHTDIYGNEIIGIVQSANKDYVYGEPSCREADVVYFPPHDHCLGGCTRDHTIHPISSSIKYYVEGSLVCLDGDTVPVADEAGPDAYLEKSQTTHTSN